MLGYENLVRMCRFCGRPDDPSRRGPGRALMSGGVEPVGYGVCAELASVDHTDARKATVRRFGRSHRRAQHSRFRNPFSVLRYARWKSPAHAEEPQDLHPVLIGGAARPRQQSRLARQVGSGQPHRLRHPKAPGGGSPGRSRSHRSVPSPRPWVGGKHPVQQQPVELRPRAEAGVERVGGEVGQIDR